MIEINLYRERQHMFWCFDIDMTDNDFKHDLEIKLQLFAQLMGWA